MSTDSRTRTTRSRAVRRLLVAVLVLLLVFFVGGGWYFSGRIRSDGLEVSTYPSVRNLTLTPGDGATVRITSTDAGELAMLQGPTTYGLKWRGGYLRVQGRVVEQGRGHVVRRFEVLTGRTPAAGTRAELDLAAYPDDPVLALGPDTRTVSYESAAPGGARFEAWLAPPVRARAGSVYPDVDTWAVLVHGKGGSRVEMARMGRATTAAGLTTMDITYRNDEGYARDSSGYYGYGRTEWRDLAGAVAYAADHGAKRVVLGADSMGGGIVASYLRHRGASAEGPEVAGVVLDAPMLDFGETVAFGARQISLPLLGPVPAPLTWTAQRISSLRFGIDWDAVDYLDDTSWLREPALVFHGTADTTVPLTTSRELAKDQPRRVTLVTVPGTEHVRSWNTDPTAYDGRIASFVEQVTR